VRGTDATLGYTRVASEIDLKPAEMLASWDAMGPSGIIGDAPRQKSESGMAGRHQSEQVADISPEWPAAIAGICMRPAGFSPLPASNASKAR
jgi:hypothetical protein